MGRDYIPRAVAYRKKTGKKVWVKEFTDLPYPDKLLTKRSKLLPEGSEIVELGVGKNFYEKYCKKYA